MRLRLYLDEDVSSALVELLAAKDVDAVSARGSGAPGLSDEQQLSRAASEGRCLLTYNCRDFARIARDWSVAGGAHAGIILSYRQYARSNLNQLADLLATFASRVTADDLPNAVFVLDNFRAR